MSRDTDQNNSISQDLSPKIASLVVETLRGERGVHAETAIASSAALVGEFVLRAHIANLSDLPPGTPILSDEVNKTLFDRDDGNLTLSDIFYNALFALGLDVSTESWAQEIPEDHKMMFDPLEVAARVRAPLEDMFAQAGVFEMLERSYAAAAATALLVAQTRKVLDPAVGKALALDGIMRGAKTVPLNPPVADA